MQISNLTTFDLTSQFENTKQTYITDKHTLIVEKDFTEHLGFTTTRDSDGFWFYRNDFIIGQSLNHYGEYTQLEIDLLNAFIQPGYVVYDIGANIGVHTVPFAKKAEKVYAFEPNDKNYKLLKMNTLFNRNVKLFNTAVSDTVGTSYVSEIDLTKLGNYGEVKMSDIGQACETVSIDHLVENKKILPPNVVKIDVEGHENSVFNGMQNTIKNNLPVIFYEAMHCDTAKIYDMLHGLAYNLYYFPCPNYNPNNFKRNKENIFGSGGVLNILAVPFYIEHRINLPVVTDRLDTWDKAIERYHAQSKN